MLVFPFGKWRAIHWSPIRRNYRGQQDKPSYVFNNPLDTGWMRGRESANVKAIRIELFDLSRRL